MNGDEINNSPGCEHKEMVINFGTRSEEEAAEFKEPFGIIVERVKPGRMKYTGTTNRDRYLRTYWWLFRGHRAEIAEFSNNNTMVIAKSVVSKHSIFTFVDTSTVCTAATYVFLSQSYSIFAQVQSTIHDLWALYFGSTLRTDPRYIVGRCFKTFPLSFTNEVDRVGREYYDYRTAISKDKGIGLTDLYNQFHDRNDSSNEIVKLRENRIKLDAAVWSIHDPEPIDFKYDFFDTPHGTRFTIDLESKSRMLRELSRINRQRSEEEQLSNKKKTRRRTKKTAAAGMLFDDEG